MISAWSTVMGIGLVILGLAGLSGNAEGSWMSWLDFVAALGSFVVAGAVRPGETGQMNRIGPLSVSVSLFLMWIVGLATASVSTTLIWWNFAFACAYGVLGLIAERPSFKIEQRPTDIRDHEKDQEKPRRVA